jgi:hypothetical protein
MVRSFRASALPSIFWTVLALLRGSRTMAVALVLLAPGIAGSAVQWLHACPVGSPGVADHQHHDSSPSESGQAPLCQCIGACNTAGVVSPSKPLIIGAAVAQPDRSVTPLADVSFVPVGTPSDLLPPATAPPLS